MQEVRFFATIGEDQMIRPPSGVSIPGGEVEVVIRPIVTAQPVVGTEVDEEDSIASLRNMLLAIAAGAERIAPPLPSDMARNHDHYAHGKPLP